MAARTFSVVMALLAAGTLIAIVVMWPGGVDAPVSEGLAAETERAEVTSVTYEDCPPPQGGQCGTAEVRIASGPDAGATLPLGRTGLEPEREPGDEIRVLIAAVPITTALAAVLATDR